jgi:hypothetical protein
MNHLLAKKENIINTIVRIINNQSQQYYVNRNNIDAKDSIIHIVSID